MGDSPPLATPCNTLFLPYKEEVAGSNTASPTLNGRVFAVTLQLLEYIVPNKIAQKEWCVSWCLGLPFEF